MPRRSKRSEDAPTSDIAAKLGLGSTQAIRDYVDRMEHCMRSAQAAADDLKGVEADAKEIGFKPNDIAAMKKFAKLRLKDQLGKAREQLWSLKKVSEAAQDDLFDFEDDA